MLEERKQVMSSVIPVSTLQDQLSQAEKCGDCYPDGVERLPVQEELPNRESISVFQFESLFLLETDSYCSSTEV